MSNRMRGTQLTTKVAPSTLAGGVREAYKRRGEEYQLFWPEKSGAQSCKLCWSARPHRSLACAPLAWTCLIHRHPPCTSPHRLCMSPSLHDQHTTCSSPHYTCFTRLALLPSPPLAHLPAEFIRMAARFGATIVPFAAVGVDDSLNIIADSQQLEALPVLGDMVKRRAGGLPQVGAALPVSKLCGTTACCVHMAGVRRL